MALYQRDIFPTFTIKLTVAITFIGFILAYSELHIVQEEVVSILVGFLVSFSMFIYIGCKRKRALVCLTVLEDIEKSNVRIM